MNWQDNKKELDELKRILNEFEKHKDKQQAFQDIIKWAEKLEIT